VPDHLCLVVIPVQVNSSTDTIPLPQSVGCPLQLAGHDVDHHPTPSHTFFRIIYRVAPSQGSQLVILKMCLPVPEVHDQSDWEVALRSSGTLITATAHATSFVSQITRTHKSAGRSTTRYSPSTSLRSDPISYQGGAENPAITSNDTCTPF
jgi:hypothetical protein